VIPLLLFAIVSGGLGDVTNIKGFPTKSFATFALAVPFVQGCLMAIATTGQTIATDIEHGFINRLALTPMRGVALLIAQLAGAVVIGSLQAAIFFGVGFAAGARIAAGFLGALVLVALFLLAVLASGAFGILLALRSGSGQTVQAVAPLTAVFLFMSSMVFPRNLIEIHWFRTVATINPMSYLVEGIRSPLVSGWDAQALALGFAVAGGLFALALGGAVVSLRRGLVSR
jgi:ABC-2 type transport system permease protein